MPISYRIDSQKDLILTTATGVLTDDDIIMHKQELLRDPSFKPGMRELSDVRSVDRLEVTAKGIERLVAQDASNASRFRCHRLALVVSADFVFGTARMYKTMTETNPLDVMVFRDIDKARAWLEDKETD